MGRIVTLTRMVFDGRGRPLAPVARPAPSRWSSAQITGSCLGHSTVLLNFFGLTVLMDPVFSSRVGFGRPPLVLGPKRYFRPALVAHEFSPPELIVLSHAHFDHFDLASLRRFSRDTPIVTARHTAVLLRGLRFRHVRELGWGQTITIGVRGESLRVTALEVAHWGARLMRDHHRGYNGYLFERGEHAVVFGGDTAYTRAFARLRDRSRPIDLMLMPIGAYNPWIRAHCSPEQAFAMAEQARARTFVPVHHETFKLSSEPMDEPGRRIRAAFAHQPERLLAVRVGETFQVPSDTAMTGLIQSADRSAA